MESKTQTTVKTPFFAPIKTKMSFIYNKLMKLVSCTTNAVETTCEPTTPIEEQEQKENEKETQTPVAEDTNVAVEQQEPKVVIEEPAVLVDPVAVQQLSLLLEPVVVEQPVSIEERM
jgi:hypothetical protein